MYLRISLLLTGQICQLNLSLSFIKVGDLNGNIFSREFITNTKASHHKVIPKRVPDLSVHLGDNALAIEYFLVPVKDRVFERLLQMLSIYNYRLVSQFLQRIEALLLHNMYLNLFFLVK